MMKIRISVIILVVLITVIQISVGKNVSSASPAPTSSLPSSLTDNGIGRVIFRVYDQCDSSDDIVKCFKVQVAKLLGRALKVQNIKLLEGISITKKSDYVDSNSRSTFGDLQMNNSDLDNISTKSLDQIFYGRLAKFLESHQIQVSIPKLLSLGQKNSEEYFESRKDKKDKKFLGPFVGAVILKTLILKMAYHSIAIVAGKALIVGKIALIISAIIGLKKLVSNEGHEKTTYEIVKHPHVQQSHTYSSSHGEYEGGGGHESSGAYRRSFRNDYDDIMMHQEAYRAHVPRT